MKAITLHQPWASLVALGVKTVETRSWRTSYRGPLAIHAAKRTPPILLKGELGAWDCCDMHYAEGEADYRLTNVNDGASHRLPLGAVVATCTLMDVLPMVAAADRHDHDAVAIADDGQYLWVRNNARRESTCINDQLPYGDFRPGRYAWLLDDIEPVEPVDARGRQQLWEWAA